MEGQKDTSATRTNFSIEHILNFAGETSSRVTDLEINLSHPENVFPSGTMSWLSCTRYCPPRIPRLQKENILKKRRVGRQARIPFTSDQLKTLEEHFRRTPYLSAAEVKEISSSLQLGDNRIKIWFQNRRARERRERCIQHEVTENSGASNNLTSENISSLSEGKTEEVASQINFDSNNISFVENTIVNSSFRRSDSERLSLEISDSSKTNLLFKQFLHVGYPSEIVHWQNQ